MNNIPKITRYILIANVAAYLLTLALEQTGIYLNGLLGLYPCILPGFHIYQLFTYMFLHGSLTHILFNMIAVWMFGSIIERTWGSKFYLWYYIICGIGAGVIQQVVDLFDLFVLNVAHVSLTIGASGAVFGLLLAFALSYPDERLFVFPIPIPIKAKYLVLGYTVIELLSGINGTGDGIAHFAHIGGLLVGFITILIWNAFSPSFSSMGIPPRWTARRRKPAIRVTKGGRYDEFQDRHRGERSNEDQAEIDAILLKLRTSGYESLSVDEKKKLFEASQK